ncbi:MAG TPA: hypothetical protein PKY56_06335 [Candidatus Kapabacteria bacterium]|nr:hypothetical protein [Candidatus Kapabacteria bacterium]HPO62693.1 hypothetical protein [Candidatus Kapabacteria bacterium]
MAAKIENNPFEEEFNRDDVVNRYNQDDEDNNKKRNNNSKEVDIDALLKYSEEDYLNRKFKDEFSNDNFIDIPTDEELLLKKNFKDFLILPNISGKDSGIANSNRIPGENVKQDMGFIEISDEIPGETNHNSGNSTMLINRNSRNEITSIEILCKCGERTVINLDYEPD